MKKFEKEKSVKFIFSIICLIFVINFFSNKKVFFDMANKDLLYCFAFVSAFDLSVLANVYQPEYALNVICLINNTVFVAASIIALGIIAALLIVLSRFKKENHRLSSVEKRYRSVEEFTGTALFAADFADGVINYSESYETLYKRKPFVKNISEFGNNNPYIFAEDKQEYAKISELIRNKQPSGSAEYRVYLGDGRCQWHRFEFKIVFASSGEPDKLIGKISNIDGAKRRMEILSAAAETDSLTGLINYEAMSSRVNAYLKNEGKDGIHALMILDVDNFKFVNDKYGHLAGDEILRRIANGINKQIRATDIAARYGGDEFLIFLKNISSADFAAVKAGFLCELLQYAANFENKYINVTSSIGII